MPTRTARNLPATRTSLIGRERDVAETRDLICHGTERLLTLTGAGGCGKTRLALAVAASVRDAFRDGVWLVELAGISDPLVVPEAVSAALGVRESTSDGIQDVLIAALRPLSLLIVLDNCEHLIDACANLADTLLSNCPDLRILATSREPLNISGERRRPVHPLEVPLPGHSTSPEDLARCPAVQLFVERASVVEPSFQFTPENAATVARICTLLGGIPLALELAAARVRMLSPTEILDRLDDSPRLLCDYNRSMPPRQQTLKATLDWSYGLLSPFEKVAFRRLSLPVGSWDARSAEAICVCDGLQPAETLEVLARLIDKSLVQVELREGKTRYRLLEPVRQYGYRLLAESGELDETNARLAEYCLALAERAGHELIKADQAEWLRQLDLDIDNIRAALRWADACGEADIIMRMVVSLCWYFYMRHVREGLRWLAAALKHQGAIPTEVRAKALDVAGTLCNLAGNGQKGIKYCQEALALHREAGNIEGLSRTHATLSLIGLTLGDFSTARSMAEQSIALARQCASRQRLAYGLIMLGQVLCKMGDTSRAVELHSEALALFRGEGDEWGSSFAMANLAAVHNNRADVIRGAALACVRFHWEHGDRQALVAAIENLARVGRVEHRERQVTLFAAARTLRQSLGAPSRSAERGDVEPFLTLVRQHLGQARFSDLWNKGVAMSVEEMVAFALDEQPSDLPAGESDAPIRAIRGPQALTPRERQVAKLLARGYSDREISEHLTVTLGTTRQYVHHVLEKLGLHSRFQVAHACGFAAKGGNDHVHGSSMLLGYPGRFDSPSVP